MRINISVPNMKLQVIDLYCKEKGLNRSSFLSNLALSYINKTKGTIKCEKCPNGAIGRFNLLINDWDQGEIKISSNLCQKHLDQAKKEGIEINEQLGTS